MKWILHGAMVCLYKFEWTEKRQKCCRHCTRKVSLTTVYWSQLLTSHDMTSVNVNDVISPTSFMNVACWQCSTNTRNPPQFRKQAPTDINSSDCSRIRSSGTHLMILMSLKLPKRQFDASTWAVNAICYEWNVIIEFLALIFQSKALKPDNKSKNNNIFTGKPWMISNRSLVNIEICLSSYCPTVRL